MYSQKFTGHQSTYIIYYVYVYIYTEDRICEGEPLRFLILFDSVWAILYISEYLVSLTNGHMQFAQGVIILVLCINHKDQGTSTTKDGLCSCKERRELYFSVWFVQFKVPFYIVRVDWTFIEFIPESNAGSKKSSCPGKSQIWNCTNELFDISSHIERKP